jgi:hypothetical protein
MTVTREEEIVLLYTLYVCGRRPSKGRATEFIISNQFLKESQGDDDTVSTGESRIENRIAWIRQNLKSKGELSMPQIGTWEITGKGIERIEKTAIRSVTWEDDVLLDIFWERFSAAFLERLKMLGRTLKDKSAGSKQSAESI